MESKLDDSVPPELKSLTMTRYYSASQPTAKRTSLPVTAPVAAGTGVYFCNLNSTCTCERNCSCCETNHTEFKKLFHLASVACEVESSLGHQQLLKKRRTPRNLLLIHGSRFADVRGIGVPLAKRQKIEKLNLCSPPWVELDNRGTCSNKTILKSGSQDSHSAGAKSRQPTNPHKFIKAPYPGRLPRRETRVQRFSKRILQFVGGGSIAEKFIRAALGNNPDTSKALRLLLTQQKLKRLGDGGRGKAFLYVATPAGLRELENLKEGTHEESIIDNAASSN